MTSINMLNDQELEQVAGGAITADEALGRALEHAKLSRDQLSFKKVELDREHGRMVYEIKFYQGGFEFEYDIDAETGDILKWEKEYD